MTHLKRILRLVDIFSEWVNKKFYEIWSVFFCSWFGVYLFRGGLFTFLLVLRIVKWNRQVIYLFFVFRDYDWWNHPWNDVHLLQQPILIMTWYLCGCVGFCCFVTQVDEKGSTSVVSAKPEIWKKTDGGVVFNTVTITFCIGRGGALCKFNSSPLEILPGPKKTV